MASPIGFNLALKRLTIRSDPMRFPYPTQLGALRGDGQGQVHLSVCDGGIGLPSAFDWKNARSLGLRLVHMLAGRLQAAISMKMDRGTELSIVFPVPEAQVKSPY